MIDTAIQKMPVMGYQNKSLFPAQIIPDNLSGFHIQMIRRLINQQEMIFPCKKNSQHYFGLFSVT